jgi:hypothetical protein
MMHSGNIFDARCLPPSLAYKNTSTWMDLQGTLGSLEERGWMPTPSIEHSSIDLFFEECSSTGITHLGFPSRVKNNTWGYATNEDVKSFSESAPLPSIWYGALGTNDADPSVSEIVALGAKAIIYEPYLFEVPRHIDDPGLQQQLDEIQQHNVPVFIMMGGEYGFDIDWSHTSRLERIAQLFPRLNIVVVHSAWPKIQDVLEVAFRYKNIYLLPDVYFPGLPGEADLVLAMKTFMKDRVIYGSGYPYCPQGQQLEAIYKLGIKDDIANHFFFDNANELFTIEKLKN